MSTCQLFPTKTKAQAIEGFCDEFEGFCQVSNGVKSVPIDVERTILFDDNPNNDKNDCDGGFDFDLACPTACGTSQTTVSATYRVVADAFGGGKECPYHDGFVMERTCPAVVCTKSCEGYWGDWSGCPMSCGYGGAIGANVRTWNTTSKLPPGSSYSPACPTQEKLDCPAREPCSVDCEEGTWSFTCPTNCGYGGGNVPATLVNYKPAQYGGSCTTTKEHYCPATEPCPPCEYSAWRDYGDRGCNHGKQFQTRDVVTNGPCIHTYNFQYIHNNSPIYRLVPCEPCEVGVVSEGVHNSNDNPRRVCRWDGATTCYCTKYKVQNWGITKQGVNTSSCYWSNTIFTPTKVANGEWEGCSGCSACPRGQLSIPAR